MVRKAFGDKFPVQDSAVLDALARIARRARKKRNWTPDDSAAAAHIETESTVSLRHSLGILERLKSGWRPDERLLAGARCAERWSASRCADAAVYQFVGSTRQPGQTSLIIGALLAVDPQAGWVLLFGDRWIRLAGMPEKPLDPDHVSRCARSWLTDQLHRELSDQREAIYNDRARLYREN